MDVVVDLRRQREDGPTGLEVILHPGAAAAQRGLPFVAAGLVLPHGLQRHGVVLDAALDLTEGPDLLDRRAAATRGAGEGVVRLQALIPVTDPAGAQAPRVIEPPAGLGQPAAHVDFGQGQGVAAGQPDVAACAARESQHGVGRAGGAAVNGQHGAALVVVRGVAHAGPCTPLLTRAKQVACVAGRGRDGAAQCTGAFHLRPPAHLDGLEQFRLDEGAAETVLLEALDDPVELDAHVLVVAVATDVELHATVARAALYRHAGNLVHELEDRVRLARAQGAFLDHGVSLG